jgi:hypothetical protein
MEIVSRAEAKAKGLKRYFTGATCKHGHTAPQFVANSRCVVCARASHVRHHSSMFVTIDGVEVYVNASALRRKYGITLDWFIERYPLGCAVCGRAFRPERGVFSGTACVDHCHTTGAARALLCHACNSGIGKLNDDPELLLKAHAYLIKHQQGT